MARPSLGRVVAALVLDMPIAVAEGTAAWAPYLVGIRVAVVLPGFVEAAAAHVHPGPPVGIARVVADHRAYSEVRGTAEVPPPIANPVPGSTRSGTGAEHPLLFGHSPAAVVESSPLGTCRCATRRFAVAVVFKKNQLLM